MNLKLLLVLTVLCLSGCGTHSVKDDSPASDLDALVSSVSRDLKPTLLPNGREYCAELARTERAQDECMGDLEDALYTSNRDKLRASGTLRTGAKRIEQARNPCGWWARLTQRARCRDPAP